MRTNLLVEKISSGVKDVVERAEVLRLRQHSTDTLEKRAKRLLAEVGEAFEIPVGRSDWVVRPEHTLIRMPGRAWALYHHASGAMRVNAGLEPMEALIGPADNNNRAELMTVVEKAASRLNLRDFIGENSVKFEHLWSIKAAAADRQGQRTETVLCRVVAVYRQLVNGLSVWGPASVALKLAGGGRLDSLMLQMRETTREIVDRPKILEPADAAQNIVLQLETLMANAHVNLDEATKVEWVRFGYLSLPARKPQTMLAPVYVAALAVAGERIRQAYILATPATEKNYMSLAAVGMEAAVRQARDAAVARPLPKMKTLDKKAALAAFGQR